MSAPVDRAIKYWELHEISTSCLRYGDVRVDDWGVLPGAVNDHRDVHVNGPRFLSLIRHYLKFLEVVSLLPAEGANCRWFIWEGRGGN